MPDTNAARQGLDVVVRFLNTRDVERDQDDFTGPEPLRDWLVAEGLIGLSDQITRNDVARAVEFREALRALAFTNHGGPVDERTFGVLNRVTETAPLRIRFEHESARLLPRGTGIAGALAYLAGIVFTATADGTFTRLKVCLRDSCRWAFVDRSRNRSRSWCSMAVCGNRTKAEVYRERHTTR